MSKGGDGGGGRDGRDPGEGGEVWRIGGGGGTGCVFVGGFFAIFKVVMRQCVKSGKEKSTG